jgi:Spy/CpxP family protein refolding chaperone
MVDREMFKNALAILAAITVFLSPVICQAKEVPPGRWWHIPYFADQLQITDQQKDELDKLFDYNRNRLAELKKQMEQERSELLKAFDQEHLNESTAITQMKKLESTRTLLAATRFSYSLELRKMLGHERYQRLKTLYRNWPGAPQ